MDFNRLSSKMDLNYLYCSMNMVGTILNLCSKFTTNSYRLNVDYANWKKRIIARIIFKEYENIHRVDYDCIIRITIRNV